MAQDLKQPKVSVVMTVYNGQRYLRAAIDGVLAQTFKDFEFIIVDDGSTDDTPNIIAEYAKKDKRIKPLHHSNHGLVYSLNRAIKQAVGEYIARHDADDISLPSRFQKQCDYLDNDPNSVVVGTDYIEIDGNGNELRTAHMPRSNEAIRLRMYFEHVFAHGSVMMRRKAWEQAGGYRQEYWPGEDLDLWRRMAEFGKLTNLSESLYKYRLNEQGISLSNLERQQKQIRKIHAELRNSPLLLPNKHFLAAIKVNDPHEYQKSQQEARMLAKQMTKRGKVRSARLLSSALSSKTKPKSTILMASPTKWLGGGEVYTETIVNGLSDKYSFYLMSGQKLRDRLGGKTKKSKLPVFPFSLKQKFKRTRPLEEMFYKGLYHTRLRFADIDAIDIQAYEPALLRSLGKQKIPVIFTAHTRFPMRGKQECGFVRGTLRNVSRIICVSEASKNDLIEIGVSDEELTVIHNGIDTQKFKPTTKKGEYITWIGRIEDELKNPMLFVDIARIAKKTDSKLKFRLVGEGSLVPRIKEIIAKEDLDNLELPGFITDTPKLLNEASLLCLTSTSESLPLVILEAMSSGVPVVSTDVGGVKEIISSDKLGVVLSSQSPAEFYRAIKRVLGSKDYPELSRRVREHILHNFSQDKMLLETANLFERVTNHFK